ARRPPRIVLLEILLTPKNPDCFIVPHHITVLRSPSLQPSRYCSETERAKNVHTAFAI
uniref:Uncharacterized protein n=1 Tax=Caenorhabditis japonica TaxID=281687 RepID=A0A8R1EJX0_CAEJA